MSALPFAYAWRWKAGVTWKLTLTKNPNAHEGIEIKELFDHSDRAGLVIEQQAEIERLTAIIAVMDASSPRADHTCAEPGITLSQAVEREYPHLARAVLEVKP